MIFKNIISKLFPKKIKKIVRTNLTSKVLIVDDATVNRYILKKYIEKCILQLEIHEADNGLTAIEMCKLTNYDIIFMDIRMPGIDGIETTKIILKRDPYIVIFGTTGQIEAPVAKEALDSGMQKCIGKPINLQTIKYLLDIVYNPQD